MLIDPRAAICSDLPELLAAAAAHSWPVHLYEERGRVHVARSCAGGRSQEYTLDGSRGEKLPVGSLCAECELVEHPALPQITHEGACQPALEHLQEIKTAGELLETARTWQILYTTSFSSTRVTLQAARAAMQELQAEWKTWQRGRLGADEQAHIVIGRVLDGPGTAVYAAGRRCTSGMFTLVTIPRAYEELLTGHADCTGRADLEVGDSTEILETALTLWVDAPDGAVLSEMLGRARLIHQG